MEGQALEQALEQVLAWPHWPSSPYRLLCQRRLGLALEWLPEPLELLLLAVVLLEPERLGLWHPFRIWLLWLLQALGF